MGKYQWIVWALCGFGYLIDLLWAQAFALALSPLQQEYGFGSGQTGNIAVSFNAGLTAGAFVWGVLADIVGRRFVFNSTVLFASVFGLSLGVSDTYSTFLILTALVGFGVGGNVPIDTTIALEFIPQNKRFLLAVLSIFQPIGVVLCSAIAFGFIPIWSCSPNFSEPDPLPSCSKAGIEPETPCCSHGSNMGWRYFLYTLGGISLFVFCLRSVVFQLKESPRYLAAVQSDIGGSRTTDGWRWLHGQLANSWKVGGETTTAITDRKYILNHERNYGAASWMADDASHNITWLTYILDFWGFTVAGAYLPRILALKNGSYAKSLQFTYASYIYTYAPGIAGVLLGAFFYHIPSIGRKWTMTVSSGLMGTSILLFSTVDTVPKNLGLFAMEYFFQSMFNAVLYGWTPQAFPASVRGSACGLASFWGRLSGIVSPLIAQSPNV